MVADGKLPDSLIGNIDFNAHEGRIYKFDILRKILSLLNVTQIVFGKVPQLSEEGLPFNTIRMKGVVRGNVLVLSEFHLRGPTLGLAAEGTINLATRRVDLR